MSKPQARSFRGKERYMFNLPVSPGHASADEMLAVLANPVENITQEVLSVPDAAAVLVAPLAGRKTIILQVFAGCWLSFGTTAVKHQCLYIGAGGMFGLDVADSVVVSLLSDSGAAVVVVVQTGAGGLT